MNLNTWNPCLRNPGGNSVSVPARGIMNLKTFNPINTFNYYVSVPARGIMNLNFYRKTLTALKQVSVPARGIMNLNYSLLNRLDWLSDFRPRSGNYESEYLIA